MAVFLVRNIDDIRPHCRPEHSTGPSGHDAKSAKSRTHCGNIPWITPFDRAMPHARRPFRSPAPILMLAATVALSGCGAAGNTINNVATAGISATVGALTGSALLGAAAGVGAS